MTRAALLLAVIAIAAPARGEPMTGKTSITLRARKPGRPPIQRIEVDLDVSNPDAQPCWVLLPAHADKLVEPAAVDGVEPVALTGGVVVGTFQGTGAFVALRLAAHGHVVVKGLELSSATKLTQIEIVRARALSVDGKPAEAWFPRDPTSTNATAEWSSKAPLEARHTADRHEVPVRFDAIARETLPLRDALTLH